MKKDLVKFVVRKYVMAQSAAEAIKNERKTPVHDVWVDEKWLELQANKPELGGFGFQTESRQKKERAK